MSEPCLICGGPLVLAVARPRSSYTATGTYRIEACQQCGAGATIPRPTSEVLAQCYEATYGYSTHDLIEFEKRRRATALLDWSGVTTGRILDVGCMFGFLLDEARRRGLVTQGVELSSSAAAVARDHGHDVFVGTIEQYVEKQRPPKFAAIFAQHVLEHTTDPRSFLETAKSLLEPGGQVVVAVPNFEARLRKLAPSGWGWYQVPVHLHHFSARSLRKLVDDAGLELVEQRTRGGDTLFLALSALQTLGLSPSAASESARPKLARTALRLIGEVTRPYYALGDDELAIIARA